jgi:hypothetical protein
MFLLLLLLHEGELGFGNPEMAGYSSFRLPLSFRPRGLIFGAVFCRPLVRHTNFFVTEFVSAYHTMLVYLQELLVIRREN